MSNDKNPFAEFVRIVRALRHPQTGCPWDLEQTHESLRPYLVEECYEVLEAIEAKDDKELLTELGDVLLQVVLHSQVASERNAFTIDDVVQAVTDKMVRRHPHVFGETKGQVKTASEVINRWEAIKHGERKEENKTDQTPSRLAGIPIALPALIRAQRLGEKASKANFDWRSTEDVWTKVEEELGELKEELNSLLEGNASSLPCANALFDAALAGNDEALPSRREEKTKNLQHELGDVLFALTQLARKLNFSAEDALRGCCDRFIKRFSALETSLGEKLFTASDDELEAEWQKAKAKVG